MKAKQIALALVAGGRPRLRGGSEAESRSAAARARPSTGSGSRRSTATCTCVRAAGRWSGDYVKHERAGRIQGDIEGDLLVFQWEDRRELVVRQAAGPAGPRLLPARVRRGRRPVPPGRVGHGRGAGRAAGPGTR